MNSVAFYKSAVVERDNYDKLLLPREVQARVRLSPKTIYRLRRKNQFPAPIVLGERRHAWRESDIENWLTSRSKAALACPAEAE
ncbi:helix-turn-helix transcriptional regulator [Microvirga aerophila]|uniref:Uncharacterized protein n=1 Tax=Microvirga aerophila TaxID=670291 RepID=A0A512C1W9_9HYPH|nr:AlpA family phage regulatory protein [Microvirga aerophila]GEO18206.1 hypothetical protein MAE02_59020 [Microvirga aerophila]